MSKKRKLRDTKKSLKQLKAKRANYAVGGYGYGGGSRRRADSVAIELPPVANEGYKKGTGTVPETGSKPKTSNPNSTRTGYGSTSGTAAPQVMTRGEDGNMYPNPAAAAAANETYRASQVSRNPRTGLRKLRCSVFPG